MRKSLLFLNILALLAVPAQAMKPPREESPAPRDVLESFGAGNSDDALARAIAAAEAHPLGTLENPIRVGGPLGERAYLARLRCSDGSLPVIGTASPIGIAAFGSVANVFPVECAKARIQARIVMDMYHAEHIENRAPPGFTIEPSGK